MMDSGGAGRRIAKIEEERELNAYQRGGRGTGTGGDDKKDKGDEGQERSGEIWIESSGKQARELK